MTTHHPFSSISDGPLLVPSPPPVWCYQHLAWECPYIWGAGSLDPATPKFCCHQPLLLQHEHGDPPSLSISAGIPTDTVHLAALERIRDAQSLPHSNGDAASLPSTPAVQLSDPPSLPTSVSAFAAADMWGNCLNCPAHATDHRDGWCP